MSQLRECFFETVFRLLGYIAKCDGAVTGKEIKRNRVFMDKLDLTPECRVEAQVLFNYGASREFDIQETIDRFRHTAEKSPSIVQILLVYLISMATTDGPLLKEEMAVVQKVAAELGYSSILFDHLLQMIAAQDRFGKTETPKSEQSKTSGKRRAEESGGKRAHAETSLDQYLAAAFKSLNIPPSSSEAEIKKAYRRLVSQFHPDKLIDQGLPPELLSAATERFRVIRMAYEYIRKHHLDSQAA